MGQRVFGNRVLVVASGPSVGGALLGGAVVHHGYCIIAWDPWQRRETRGALAQSLRRRRPPGPNHLGAWALSWSHGALVPDEWLLLPRSWGCANWPLGSLGEGFESVLAQPRRQLGMAVSCAFLGVPCALSRGKALRACWLTGGLCPQGLLRVLGRVPGLAEPLVPPRRGLVGGLGPAWSPLQRAPVPFPRSPFLVPGRVSPGVLGAD